VSEALGEMLPSRHEMQCKPRSSAEVERIEDSQ
jgi:hypothetical protein